MYLPILRVKRKKKDQRKTSNDAYAMFKCVCVCVCVCACVCVCVCVFSDLLYKSICFWYSFELHRQVDAIQMGTQNIFLYKQIY